MSKDHLLVHRDIVAALAPLARNGWTLIIADSVALEISAAIAAHGLPEVPEPVFTPDMFKPKVMPMPSNDPDRTTVTVVACSGCAVSHVLREGDPCPCCDKSFPERVLAELPAGWRHRVEDCRDLHLFTDLAEDDYPVEVSEDAGAVAEALHLLATGEELEVK